MTIKDFKKYTHIIFLGLACVVAYWPVSFYLFSLKNDALNFFLPVRHQISEAIYNGYYPFWSPYLNLGYPLYGDMQSGAWNPLVWLLSLQGPYSLYTLHIETLAYVFISGIGMTALLSYMRIDKRINLMCSVAYMLSGFVIDSSQFLVWTASAAFIPLIILFLFKTLNERRIFPAIMTGLFAYLMFVCAYPAHFVMIFYICLITLISHMFSAKHPARVIPYLLILVVTFIILSLPAIISYVQFLKFSYRGSGTSYVDAMSNPFHPFYIISWLTPLPVFNSPYFQITDQLGRNAYFGIITLFFAISAFFVKINHQWIKFSKWGFVISLVFSFGELGGLRPLTYYVLPLMDVFRHPSSARVLTTLFACLLCALLFNETLKKEKPSQVFLIVLRVVAGIYFILLCWSIIELISKYSGDKETLAFQPISSLPIGHAIKKIIQNLQFHELLIMNIAFQIPFLYIIYHKGVKQKRWYLVARAGTINSVLTAAMLMPFSVVKKDYARGIQKTLSDITVKGYPLPDLSRSLAENTSDSKQLFDKIGPSNMYNKEIGRTNYYITPSNLLTQREFWSDTILRAQIMSKPLLFADCETEIRPISMNPNEFSFHVNSASPCYYILIQNYYPGWQILLDDNKIFPEKAATSFMGVHVPKGSHKIKFKFNPLLNIALLWISLVSLSGIIIYGITIALKAQHHRSVS